MAKSNSIRVDVLNPWNSDLSDPEVAKAWGRVGEIIVQIASEGRDLPTQWCNGDAPKGVRF